MVQVSWIVENEIAIGPRPGLAFQRLKELGFKHDIDLNADPEEAYEALRVGLNYHPLEVRDTDSLQVWLAKLNLVIRIINGALEKKEPVYLHCTYGKGRSPTFVMAYLISQGHSIQEAMQLVNSKHPNVWSSGNPTSKYTEILEAYTKHSGRQA
jgi:protein-tyrosine phosphatase